MLGATVGALLVLRLAAPYVGDAVPRWVLIGGAGAVLIAVGATWERRLHRGPAGMLGYVRGPSGPGEEGPRAQGRGPPQGPCPFPSPA